MSHSIESAPGVSSFSVLLVAFLFAAAVGASELSALPPAASGDCYPTSIGGISRDGGALLVTERCFPPVNGVDGFRGTLFRFDPSSASPTLRDLGPGYFTDLSGDGRSALGNVFELDPVGRERSRAFLVRDLDDRIDLGFLTDDDPYSFDSMFATSISADGTTVVGGAVNGRGVGVPAIWTAATGMQPLSGLPTDIPEGERDEWPFRGGDATDVSADGSVVSGYFLRRPFLFDSLGDARPFSIDRPPRRVALSATAVSGDGQVVVGWGSFDGEGQPFLWSPQSGMVDLHDPASSAGSGRIALDVSGGGEIVVGGDRPIIWVGTPTFEDRAFAWTPERGARDLREVLETIGVATAEWASLVTASRVSEDGSTVVGTGVRWNRNRLEAFRTRVTPPLPAGVGGCTVGRDGCFPVEVLARSGQTIRRSDDRYSSSLEVVSSFERASVNERGEVAYSGTVIPAFGLPGEPLPHPTSVVFGPDGRGGLRACPWHPIETSEPGVDERWMFSPGSAGAENFALLADGSVVLSGRIVNPSEWPSVPEIDGIWQCRGRARQLSTVFQLATGQLDASGELIDSILPRFRVDGLGHVSMMVLSTPVDRPAAGPYWTLLATSGAGVREPLFRPGEMPPGITDLPYQGATGFNVSATGKLVVTGALGDPRSPVIGADSALWATNRSGEIELVYRSGAPVPGDASARTFGSSVDPMNPPAINDDGVIAFAVRLHGGTEPESSIWKWTPDGVSAKIVEEGIMLPGLPPDRTLEAVLDPIVDARGDVLFLGLLDGDSAGQNDAYWLHTVEGEFIALLRTGQQAPGLPNGIQLAASNYVEVSPDRELAHMALSDGGLALLEFALAGPGVDDTNDRALYVVNRAGEATLVVRRGDAVQTAAGEMRTVDEFSVWYGFRGETARRPVNDRGDVVAILAFTDETSALVRFSTPEPSAGTAIASASLALTFAFASRGRPRTRMVRWRRRLPHRGP